MILGIRVKLLASFIGLAVITIVLGGFAISAFERLNQGERVMYEDVFGGTYLVALYADRASDGRALVLEYLMVDDPARHVRLRTDMANLDAELSDVTRKMDEADTDRLDVETLARLNATWQAYVDWRDRALQMRDSGDRAGALLSYETEGASLAMQADDAIGSFLVKKDEVANQIASAGQANYESTRRVAMLASVGAAGFAALVGLLLSHTVASAAGQVAQAARGLAVGDLNQRVKLGSGDELGQMAAAVDGMIAYQQDMARVANAIAQNDLTQDVQPKSPSDVLGTAFQRMTANLRVLVGQLREREERVRTVLDSVADGVVSVDEQGLIESLNPAAERIFGYPAADIVGKPVGWLVAEVLEHTGPREWTGRRADGRRFPLDLTENRLEHGTRWRSILTVSDATKRKQAEHHAKQLIESEKMRALGQMASGIAHDLNQSLALISGYGELARQSLELERDPHVLRNYLSTVVQAALDGGETVNRLLTFVQHRTDAPSERIDLSQSFPEIVQLTAPRWRDTSQPKGHQIDLQVDVVGDVVIQGWPHRLREALTNLIFNAVEAMPEGGTICLRAHHSDDRVVVEVSDTGVGMPSDVQARIFEPFFTTKGERGTGLGLPQVYGIVQQHQGEISVESSLGRGTTFRLAFPAAPPLTRAPLSKVAEPEPAPMPLHILAVDDEPAQARMLALMLHKHGHKVEIATSGELGLERLEQGKFDLVITDLGLDTGLNGWQVADEVLRRWPHMRVVLATGWGAGIDPAVARARGIEAVLSKPYSAETLRRMVAGIANGIATVRAQDSQPAGPARP